ALVSVRASSPSELHTLSLHDALPISSVASRRSAGTAAATGRCWSGAPSPRLRSRRRDRARTARPARPRDRNLGDGAPLQHRPVRSEEHTSELQSLTNLVCRLLLANKN